MIYVLYSKQFYMFYLWFDLVYCHLIFIFIIQYNPLIDIVLTILSLAKMKNQIRLFYPNYLPPLLTLNSLLFYSVAKRMKNTRHAAAPTFHWLLATVSPSVCWLCGQDLGFKATTTATATALLAALVGLYRRISHYGYYYLSLVSDSLLINSQPRYLISMLELNFVLLAWLPVESCVFMFEELASIYYHFSLLSCCFAKSEIGVLLNSRGLTAD